MLPATRTCQPGPGAGCEVPELNRLASAAGEKRAALGELGWDADLKEYRPFLPHAEFEALGWETDLIEYRPFLSHAELEAFFGRPSDLFDLLVGVLGLEDLTAADKRLQAAAKVRDDKPRAAKQALAPLHGRLTTLANGGSVRVHEIGGLITVARDHPSVPGECC